LPCSFWLGQVSSNQPTGPMCDMNNFVLAYAVAQTESLRDSRLQSGQMAVVREGEVTNIKDLAEEATKSFGVVTTTTDSSRPLSDTVQFVSRTPNDTWRTWGEIQKQLMFETTRINEAMLGEHSARQSAIAKEAEITQAMTVNAVYIDNMNRSWEYHQRLKLKLVPYFYADWEVLQIVDEETGDRQILEINAPTGYDVEGNVVSVANDLSSNRYSWKINYSDDSANAKMMAIEEALTIVNAAAGPLAQADPTGTMFSDFLAALDNPILKKAGKHMAETAQQTAQQQQAQEQQKLIAEQTVKYMNALAALERAQKADTFLNFRAEDLRNYPELLEILVKLREQGSAKVEQDLQMAQQAVVPQAPDMGMDMAGQEAAGTPQEAIPAEQY